MISAPFNFVVAAGIVAAVCCLTTKSSFVVSGSPLSLRLGDRDSGSAEFYERNEDCESNDQSDDDDDDDDDEADEALCKREAKHLIQKSGEKLLELMRLKFEVDELHEQLERLNQKVEDAGCVRASDKESDDAVQNTHEETIRPHLPIDDNTVDEIMMTFSNDSEGSDSIDSDGCSDDNTAFDRSDSATEVLTCQQTIDESADDFGEKYFKLVELVRRMQSLQIALEVLQSLSDESPCDDQLTFCDMKAATKLRKADYAPVCGKTVLEQAELLVSAAKEQQQDAESPDPDWVDDPVSVIDPAEPEKVQYAKALVDIVRFKRQLTEIRELRDRMQQLADNTEDEPVTIEVELIYVPHSNKM